MKSFSRHLYIACAILWATAASAQTAKPAPAPAAAPAASTPAATAPAAAPSGDHQLQGVIDDAHGKSSYEFAVRESRAISRQTNAAAATGAATVTRNATSKAGSVGSARSINMTVRDGEEGRKDGRGVGE